MQTLIETEADKAIIRCLDSKKCFSMIAGAGSGKTTSLINTLKHLKENEGEYLRRNNQRVLCITYTNRAVDVISNRLDWDDLFLVSTLHSFLWGEIKHFELNIKESLINIVIPAKIEKKKGEDNGGQSKKAVDAREKKRSLQNNLEHVKTIERFEYSDTSFSNYSDGQLSHDDVIDVAAHLMSSNVNLRRIIGQKFPYIFVDEAQDTFPNVVEALNKFSDTAGLPIIGYFGDPMQQIYDERVGDFMNLPNFTPITKTENFRCCPEVIDFLNAFRTDVKQYPAGKNAKIAGSVEMRLVKAEKPGGDRNRYTDEQTQRASLRFEEALANWGWKEQKDVKLLFLVRQMIARRLGFPELQKLFTGQFASQKAQDDYETGEHFLLKPLVSVIYPLVQAARDGCRGQTIDILRRSSPTFYPLGVNSRKTLGEMIEQSNQLIMTLSELWNENTVGDIYQYCREKNLCEISERLVQHLDRVPREDGYNPELHSEEKGEWLADKFMSMLTTEIAAFAEFINDNTPFSTQHGVKGEEYEKVVVVFDDTDAAWNKYSFTKLLTPDTSGNPTEGQYDRSRKLAYVCFSRAEKDLRVLLFTMDPERAKRELVNRGLLEEQQISIAE